MRTIRGPAIFLAQFAGDAARVGPLHRRIDAGMREHVGPQGGEREVRGLREAAHGIGETLARYRLSSISTGGRP